MPEVKESLLPKPEDEILEQVSKEIATSRDFVREKRDTFRNRLKLYNNQRKQRDKIGDTSIYNIMNTLMAVYYTDTLEVSFSGRQLGDAEMAENIDNTAKFDYDEMGMETINYLTQWDRMFFGVGIRQLSEWDTKRKTPIAKSIDTLSWLPDPAGYLSLKNFRFIGFEVEYAKGEMTEEAGFFNVDMLKASNKVSETDTTREYLREAQGLSDTPFKNDPNEGLEIYDVVEWFTSIEDDDGVNRKYLITVSDDVKTLIRCEELEAVTAEEKEDPSLVPFPFSLNYYSPTRQDPFGVSVCDLVEDKQRAKSILKNLKLASIKASIYPMYIYNRDKILNRRDLDFAFNKFIAVRGDTSNTLEPINKAPTRFAETTNEEQAMDRDIELSTGADRVSQGVTSAQQRTLGETEMVMANANLRFMLGSRINAWGEKRFWKLWYRLYKQNLKNAEEKVIRLQSAIGIRYSTITRKDFITKEDPDIRINSKLELERKRQEEKVAFASIMPLITADPTKPIASKRYMERRLLRLNGVPQDEINVISPETPDESRAKMENELLSRNEQVKIKANEDHLSHNVVHSQADMTDATRLHIESHKRAYIQSGEAATARSVDMAGEMGAGRAAENVAGNQIANQNAQMNSGAMKPKGVQPMG